jgi:nucleoid-associated protein YgaU
LLRSTGQVILFLLLLSLCACATQPPRYRIDAAASLERARRAGPAGALASELESAQQTFDRGESLLQLEEYQDADRYFFLTLQKGALLEKEIAEDKARRREEARLAEVEKKAELERRAQEEAQRLARAKAESEAKAEAEALARREAAEAERRRAKPQREREHLLVSSYTVRRGESLPLIASQPEVYGDRNLWPLLYRANRDQISDPRHIWPGQVLRIPRNLGRDDIAEARRYSQERPLH